MIDYTRKFPDTDNIHWIHHDVVIHDHQGREVFAQAGVEAPDTWSKQAVTITASKYFRGQLGTPGREHSVRDMVRRVTHAIGGAAVRFGYLTRSAANLFQQDLTYLVVNQMASFNSPVWFNVGAETDPQTSACFILGVEDNMTSILQNVMTEGMIFKHGSGVGSNLSRLRGSMEPLSSGGTASGPVSFMRGFDAFAGVIKSGGRTRRAAIMRILDVDHPDIVEFITCKAKEEERAAILFRNGQAESFTEALNLVAFQNANNSVRVTDKFMRAAANGEDWPLHARSTKATTDTLKASQILRQIAESAWRCGDPGLQFQDAINRWHTCPADGEIVASNPCSEYLFLNETSCNLASLNLVRFLDMDGRFNCDLFDRAIRTMILAQDILVDLGGYPTPAIAEGSHRYRTLGLGYANLGAMLMAMGLPYDGEESRIVAGEITARMTAMAYLTSADLAEGLGAFPAFASNGMEMRRVISTHAIQYTQRLEPVMFKARERWMSHERSSGLTRDLWHNCVTAKAFRNAQVTVLAPTGTIAFMMDCDTTGMEPELALIKGKQLVGGGEIKTLNGSIVPALRRLGYREGRIGIALTDLRKTGSIYGAIDTGHWPIFDCALPSGPDARTIPASGHLLMMAALQPFLSGGISKTVNLPSTATVEDVESIFQEAGVLGLKSVSLYRDGSKIVQPLQPQHQAPPVTGEVQTPRVTRRRLPDTRRAVTHKFDIAGHEGYVTVGCYDDGTPGEVFLTMNKAGSTINGFADAFAIGISHALQYGVPLRDLVEKLTHIRFDPAGRTRNPKIKFAKSIVDYVFRWMDLEFGDKAQPQPVDTMPAAGIVVSQPGLQSDAPPCPVCGSMTTRSGSCYRCDNCGNTTGCA
jgi:ribonucleoside-diphosphate reductase alpha chain